MNNEIWEHLKLKKPVSVSLKTRKNESLTVVAASSMEICFLNETAGFILNLCDESHTLESICDELLEQYDVSRDELTDDLVKVIRYMQWKRIIKLC
ncbi:MAG: PqqD family protein [Lachnospiraceae bacterium]|nr:PqqD family protein [Lachnospiraceae bacterium]